MQSGTFVASLVAWQEGPSRSFDWAQALRPVHPAYNGAINSLPALLEHIVNSPGKKRSTGSVPSILLRYADWD